MVSRLFSLIGLWFLSFSAMAETNQDLIKNLRTRLHALPNDKGELIQSYPTNKQSYIYDQALAIVAFVKEGDRFAAQSLLRGLEGLQLPDGSLYFSYYITGESPYPIEGDKRYAGAIAWTAIAANHYQNTFKSDEFVDFNIKVLNYLSKQIVPIQIRGQKLMALKFSPSDIQTTVWREDETAALEHNLDAYSAFKHFNSLNSSPVYQKETSALKGFILSMWDKERSHFWSGANIKTGEINQGELYLDNQTWSLLALDTKTVNDLNFKEALNLNCESFYVEHEGIMGFMDSKPIRRPASAEFIWSEGTLGQVLAMKKYEETFKQNFICRKLTSDDILQSVLKMKKNDGGVAYATKSTNTDFTTASSVAGTTWMYFALKGINPFDLDDKKRIVKIPAPSVSLQTN